MLKVYLVEDEVNIRESIRETLDWEAAGFEYLGDAPDGELALKDIRRLKPDIVVTDIKMPFVDGLELARLVRDEFPDIRIVILSGYDDFAYAQKAIRLGVVEYLLKPISPSELMKAVNRVAVELREKRDAAGDADAAPHSVRAHQRREFFRDLLAESLAPSDVFARVTALGIPLDGRYFTAASVKPLARRLDLKREMDIAEMLSTAAAAQGGVVVERDRRSFAVIFQGDTPEEVERGAAAALAGFQSAFGEQVEGEVYTGLGARRERLHEIGRSLREADIACNHAVFTKSAGVSRFEELAAADGSPALALSQVLAEVDDVLQRGSLAEARRYAGDVARAVEGGGGEIVLYYAYIDVLMVAARFLHAMHAEPEEVLPEFRHLAESAFRLTAASELEGALAAILERTVSYREKHLANRYHDLLHRAKTYLGENYGNAELSLMEVAAHVHVSPTHFSAVFSREVGETFSDYLARLRIENAMRLLKTTSMPAAEISEKVGYKDPQYFSRVFKRTAGVSIRSFRAKK